MITGKLSAPTVDPVSLYQAPDDSIPIHRIKSSQQVLLQNFLETQFESTSMTLSPLLLDYSSIYHVLGGETFSVTIFL